LIGTLVLLGWVVACALFRPARRVTDQVDAAILRGISTIRTGWLTNVLTEIDQWFSGWTVTVVGVGLLVALMVFKRWRHLFTLLGGVLLVEFVGGNILYDGFTRPRPYDVTIIGRWAGYSLPSPPVAIVTMLCIGIMYGLVVADRPRRTAKWLAALAIGVFAFARLYLAVDHPFDIVLAVCISMGVLVNAFRFFTPNAVYPVTYRRGKTAHLDVGGRRGEALRAAVSAQLGLTVKDIKPVGLAGSGGSTPLRLTVAGDPDQYLFAKLYSMTHVRADRWYKLGRTLLYGRLEDEAPFGSVRRLVEYEDYTARVVADAGIPTAATYGIVELTPEREYLLVTEFLDGAVEIGEATVDDAIIDEALMVVRRLWDAGLAHRDIKPANLMVHDGEVKLIDVAFAQIRPSPWRQAVDLANMMLVLAVRTDPERVYDRALRLFTPEEIAEAFAATRGVASPTQLRMAMKQDGRDLVAEFRALAPERRPIPLQRWGVRRILLALVLLLGGLIAVDTMTSVFLPLHDVEVEAQPHCDTSSVMILMAQSVPSATQIPCVASLPAGWDFGRMHVNDERGTFWLDSDLGGDVALTVTLLPEAGCSVEGAFAVPSDEPGIERFERPERLPPNLLSTRYYLFEGGCVTYRFAFNEDAEASLMLATDGAVGFMPRTDLVAEVDLRSGGLNLCGARAECTGGDGT
jgi:tRNA A-37 threonylcarbamoyl transferase component Bud32